MDAKILSTLIFLPIIGIIINSIILYLIFKFQRKEATMSFKSKIQLFKKLVNITLIIFLISFVLGGSVVFLVGMRSASFNFLTIIAVIPTIVTYYFYYLIYKEYKVLINNFEQELIFEEANVMAFKKIAKISVWILLFQLAVSLVVYVVSFGAVAILMSHGPWGYMMYGGMNMNINLKLDTSILVSFLVCLLLNIVSIVYAKAVEIYQENQLTI